MRLPCIYVKIHTLKYVRERNERMTTSVEPRFSDLFKKQDVTPEQPAVDEQGQFIPVDYAVFPRRFLSFSIPKSLLTGLAIFLLYLFFSMFVMFIAILLAGDRSTLSSVFTEGYTGLDAFSTHGAFVTFAGVAVIIAAIAVAALIVRDRPFSSYTSSRGGWDWSIFFKCFAVAAVVYGIFTIAQLFISGDVSNTVIIRYSIAGLVISILLLPFQCLAEEYIFRGYILQFFGALFKIPIIAIIIQALIFGALHPYNNLGVIAVIFSGLLFGFLVWCTRGIEASAAVHIVNNFISFILAGISIQAITTDVDMLSMGIGMATELVVVALIIILGKRGHWFKQKKDGVTPYNTKYAQKKNLQPPYQAQ